MTQITGGLSTADAKVEYSANGSSWTDISGSASSVKVPEGVRVWGEKSTHSGDTPIVTGGKRKAQELEITCVYTEGSGDPFEVVRAAYEAKTAAYIRYSPKGTAGSFQFTTDASFISALKYPDTDAESGDPAIFSFKIPTGKLTKSVSAT